MTTPDSRHSTCGSPPCFAAAFVRAGLRNLPTSYDVEVLVDGPAEAVRARVGRWVSVEEAGAGCRIRMSTDSLDWAALAVGAAGAEFTVVTPEELGAHLRGWGERFVRATVSLPA